MKKNLYLLMALLFSCSLIFSCSDSDDEGPDGSDGPDGPDPEEVVGPDVDGTYNNGGTLELTYSGVVLLGEQTAVFAAASDKKTATITLNGVFPGVTSAVILNDVELVATETTYTFGPAEASSNGWSFTYSGTVDKDGMTVALTSIQMPTHDLLGTWTLDENTPLFMNWDSNANFNVTITLPDLGERTIPLPASFLASQIPGQFSDQLVGVLQKVSFLEDGNITAIYSAEAQTSPINMAQYYVEDGQVKILLNISAIMAAVMGNLTGGDGDFDFTELLPLIEQFADLINNGIPLAYTTEGDVLTVTLGTEVIMPIVSMLVENEDIMGLLSNLVFPYPNPIGQGTIDIPLSLLLPDLPAVLKDTNVLEAGLIMNSAE